MKKRLIIHLKYYPIFVTLSNKYTLYIILRIFIFVICSFPTAVIGQIKYDEDSIARTQDTITLQEVSISANLKTKVSGMLTGDLKLHIDQLKSVPALTGTLDVLKLMGLTPSVRTSGDGSSNMYVRT